MTNIFLLLSTYNGEKFLEEQLSSLKKQSIPFQLLVRDDGSSDRTLEILNRWKKEIPLKILAGQNVGVIESFNVLLNSLPPEADYVFFCDQDDIWEADKIEKSLESILRQEDLFGKKIPLLFHSNLSVIDDTSKFIHKSFWKFQSIHWKLGHRLNRLIMQNTVTGCSAVMNAPLLNLVKQVPKEAKMHDWWIALVACSFGKIITSERTLIRYRIHRNNVVGGKTRSFGRIARTLLGLIDYVKMWKLENQTRIIQVEKFLQIYKSILPSEEKEILEKYLLVSKKKFLERKYFQIRYQFLQQGWLRVLISFLLF
jgi:glycosyltransferase involved in cell wall biosynthesis